MDKIDLPSYNKLKFIEKLSKAIFKSHQIQIPPKNSKNVFEALNLIKEEAKNGDIKSLYIVSYLYYNLASEEKRKRKVTARDFEDLIASILNGEVTDETKRHNDYSLTSDVSSEFVVRYIVSNLREKSDILFDEFGISVKTSMPDNKEINMGSFAREALFHEILEDYGGERKSGLGTANQMKKVFNKISSDGKWNKFVIRFKEMVKNIFQDDFLFVIKGGSYLEIFILSAKELQQLFYDAIDSGPEEATWLINRYEGNSIRIKRDPVLERCKKIKIDFKILVNSPISKFNDLLFRFEDESINRIIEEKDQESFEKELIKIFKNVKEVIKK